MRINTLFDIDKFFNGATPAEIFDEVARREYLAGLKGVYSKDYLLSHKLCTAEEYDSISASTSRADNLRQAQDEAILRNKVVGAEIF